MGLLAKKTAEQLPHLLLRRGLLVGRITTRENAKVDGLLKKERKEPYKLPPPKRLRYHIQPDDSVLGPFEAHEVTE